MKFKGIFALAFLAILLTNCKKDQDLRQDQKQDQEINSELEGTWIWLKSTGGFAGTTQTPTSEGYSLTIEFSDDGYQKFQDGELVISSDYSITEEGSINFPGIVPIISYDISFPPNNTGMMEKQSFVFGGTDTLFLSDECYDCFFHIYIKE